MWLWGCFHTRVKSAFATSLPRMNTLWFLGILFSDIPQNDINKPVRAITSCEVRKSREWVWGEKNELTLDNQEVGVQVLSPWSRSLSSQHNLWDLTCVFQQKYGNSIQDQSGLRRTSESIILMFLWTEERHYYSAHIQGFSFVHNPVLLHMCVHSALASIIFESKTFRLCELVTTVWPHTQENEGERRREFSSVQIQRLHSLRTWTAWWRTAHPTVTRMKRDGLAGFYLHVLPRSYPMGLGCPHPAWVFIPWLHRHTQRYYSI